MAVKITNISGFLELLPEQRYNELRFLSMIENIYQRHGFCSVETPAIELYETLNGNGVADKEIYLLTKSEKEENEGDAVNQRTLALHFDLTVPFSRYVAQHQGKLTFPFKRYSMQKVWRGERPQKGRFREFTQCDIDIVARGKLPVAADAEVVTIISEVFATLPGLPKSAIAINNRKVLFGYFASLGLTEQQQHASVRALDKIDKIGNDGVAAELQNGEAALSSELIASVFKAHHF